jgi:hypothetical protein
MVYLSLHYTVEVFLFLCNYRSLLLTYVSTAYSSTVHTPGINFKDICFVIDLATANYLASFYAIYR